MDSVEDILEELPEYVRQDQQRCQDPISRSRRKRLPFTLADSFPAAY